MRHLKIESLPSSRNWVDRDRIMLHACFQIFKDFVAKEHEGDNIDREYHKDLIEEIQFLYKWWEKRSGLESYEDGPEDDTMLLRLMKIRANLWI